MNIRDLILRSHEAIRDAGPDATVTIPLPYTGEEGKIVRVYGEDSPEGTVVLASKNHMIVRFRARDILNYVGYKKIVTAL